MSTPARCLLAVALSFAASAVAPAQFNEPEPPPYKPTREPDEQERARRAALKKYAEGMLGLREDRLVEALRALEEAARLDPQAVAVYKALIPLYAGFDRFDDAADACKKALDLAPKDAPTWFFYARQLRRRDRLPEALQALEKGVAAVDAGEEPALAEEMHHDLGVLRAETGRSLEAAEAFRTCVSLVRRILAEESPGPLQTQDLQSRLGQLYERIGQLYLQAGKYDSAREVYKEAEQVYPANSGRWNWNLAQVALKTGEHREALGYLENYLRFQPPDVQPYETKVELLEKLGRRDEVLPWLEQAVEKDRHNRDLRLLLARQFAARGQASRAEQAYLQVAADGVPAPEGYAGLFRLYKSEPRFGLPKAVRLIDETVKKVEGTDVAAAGQAKAQARAILAAVRKDRELAGELADVALAQLRRDGLEFQTTYLLAAVADQHRRPDQAERFYRAALKQVTPETEALVYGGLLRVLWQAHDYQGVIATCREGLDKAQATSRVLFHSNLARALAQVNKHDEALEQADQAVRLATENNRMALQGLRIRLLARADRLEQARQECEEMLRNARQPGDITEIRYLLSHVHTRAGRFPKAEEQLQLILEVDPTNATAANDLGYLWADQGKNLNEAERLIRKALELDREQRSTLASPDADPDADNAAYVDSLGWVLFRQGKLAEAREALERASRLPDGDDPVIWDHLGDVYYRLELADDAFRAWGQALTLYERDNVRPLDQRYTDLREKVRLLKETRSR